MFFKHVRTAVILLGLMTIITGVLYPLTVTLLAQTFFPHAANGSLITNGQGTAGSALIGQPFRHPGYFWGRLSATGPYPYNAGASSGSNYGPLHPALSDAVAERIRQLQAADPGNTLPVPADLVTASGSGLDPHISIAAARYQRARVARIRGVTEDAVQILIDRNTAGRDWAMFGEPRVNVLTLNLALNELRPLKGGN